MATTKIKRLVGDDPSTRSYYSRTELTEKITLGVRGADMPDEMPENAVVDTLLTIPGIVACEVHPYHMTVRRAEVFEWNEIEPFILKLLTAFNVGEGKLEEGPGKEEGK